jgi:hypothetical protein
MVKIGDTRAWDTGLCCVGDERRTHIMESGETAVWECMPDGKQWRVVRIENPPASETQSEEALRSKAKAAVAALLARIPEEEDASSARQLAEAAVAIVRSNEWFSGFDLQT